MQESREIRFAADHATAVGHFPGNPIIPGALLLDTILHAIAGKAAAVPSCEIRAVKFLRPVRPGDRMRIDWQDQNGETRFQCVLVETGEIALSGTLRFGGRAV